MRSFDQLLSAVEEVCSTEPPSTMLGTLWRLAEAESRESVLSAIAKSRKEIRDWLEHSVGFYNDPEDDGRDDYFAVALVEGKIVESRHFPKRWVQELKQVLKSA